MNPKPAITFSVNVETLNRQGHLVPSSVQLNGNETISEADQQKYNHTIAMIPGLGMGNMPNGYHHGDTFTLYGNQALYMKNLHATGLPDALLVVVSTDWADNG